MIVASSPNQSSLVDGIWRLVLSVGFPVARAWWRLHRPTHRGALVAIHVDRSVLLLRSSYRTAWNFPGGSLNRNETPEMAARRELAEEIGFDDPAPLSPAGEARGLWDGRRDTVSFFTLRLNALPELRLDNREIVEARLVPLATIREFALTEPVRAYLDTVTADFVAGGPGFEPRMPGSEPGVLPLNYPPIGRGRAQ